MSRCASSILWDSECDSPHSLFIHLIYHLNVTRFRKVLRNKTLCLVIKQHLIIET